jgi:hypothetical protein
MQNSLGIHHLQRDAVIIHCLNEKGNRKKFREKIIILRYNILAHTSKGLFKTTSKNLA